MSSRPEPVRHPWLVAWAWDVIRHNGYYSSISRTEALIHGLRGGVSREIVHEAIDFLDTDGDVIVRLVRHPTLPCRFLGSEKKINGALRKVLAFSDLPTRLERLVDYVHATENAWNAYAKSVDKDEFQKDVIEEMNFGFRTIWIPGEAPCVGRLLRMKTPTMMFEALRNAYSEIGDLREELGEIEKLVSAVISPRSAPQQLEFDLRYPHIRLETIMNRLQRQESAAPEGTTPLSDQQAPSAPPARANARAARALLIELLKIEGTISHESFVLIAQALLDILK